MINLIFYRVYLIKTLLKITLMELESKEEVNLTRQQFSVI
jgi:hypothetical protein